MRHLMTFLVLCSLAAYTGCGGEPEAPNVPDAPADQPGGGTDAATTNNQPPQVVGGDLVPASKPGSQAVATVPAPFFENGQAKPATTSKPELASLVTPEIVGVVVARPARVWGWPLLQQLIEQAQAQEMVQEEFVGPLEQTLAHPKSIDRITFMLDKKMLADQANDSLGISLAEDDGGLKQLQPPGALPPGNDPPGDPNAMMMTHAEPVVPTFVLETNQPLNWASMKERMPPNFQVKTYNDHEYLDMQGMMGIAMFGDTMAVSAPVEVLKKILDQQGASTTLGKQIAKLDADTDAALMIDLASHRAMAEAAADQIPLAADLVNVDMLTVSTKATSGPGSSLLDVQLTAKDQAAATQLQQSYGPMIDQAKEMYKQASQENPLLAIPLISELVNGLGVEQQGSQLTIQTQVPQQFEQVVLTMVTPAIVAARNAAKKQAEANNFKQIILAFHNFHDVNRKLPPLGDDSENNRLSWRVHLLPFLEERQLYEQFDLNAAWDSPQNKALLAQMPLVFQTQGVDEEGMTAVHAFGGEKAVLQPGGKTNFAGITDGMSYTGLIFEGAPESAVPWTKPGGLADTDPLKALGVIGDSILVGFTDGHVERVRNEPEVLRALITRNGAEAVRFQLD